MMTVFLLAVVVVLLLRLDLSSSGVVVISAKEVHKVCSRKMI